jgi:hypothetical protein
MSQQGGGRKGGGKGSTESSAERVKRIEKSVQLSWAYASLSAMSKFVSPLSAFSNFGSVVFNLFMLTLMGSVIAPWVGGMIIAIYALLIEPAFIMALVATVTAPLLSPASYAVFRANPIVRPIYDFILLLTIGLPYALMWFWEGKVVGVSAILLTTVPIGDVGWALVFFLITFFVAGFFMSHTLRYIRSATVVREMSLVSEFATAMSIWLGALVAYIAIAVMTGANFPSVLKGIGALGGFILGITSLPIFRKAVPSLRYIPLSWNVVIMIIGLSGLAGTGFYVYAIVAVTIYLAMLYMVSRDASWLWYMLVAVPASPAVAYYLGYITKLLLAFDGYLIGQAIAYFVTFAFVIIGILALVVFDVYIIWSGLKTGSLVIMFITIILAIFIFVMGIGLLSAIVNAISFASYTSQAYKYLIAPAS